MVSQPAEFRASVETYSGPLDLLLYLIRKDEVDIFDIPISNVIRQYRLYLELLQDIDPNACGEFLVVAAQLMEIKSKLLLPREVLEDGGDGLEDPRIELVRQLLEYKKFKERALLLERRLEEHRKRHNRPPKTIQRAVEEIAEPLPVGNVDVWDLLTAFHRIQIALGQRVPVHVMLEDRPVEAFMEEVTETLRRSPHHTAAFEELFTGARTRQEAIGYFLAILELAKQYVIVITQEEPGSPIEVHLRSEEETRRLQDEAVLDAAEPSPAEYLLAGEGQEALLEDAGDDDGATPGEGG